MLDSASQSPSPQDRPQRPPASAAVGSPLRLYKPRQGTAVRWGTAAALGVIVVALASFLGEQLAVFSLTVRTLAVAVVVVLGALGTYWLVGRCRPFVDFLIATEGEMKKVNWSTRREVFGATRVVIVTILALGAILFLVDLFFMAFFEAIGVLRIGLLRQLFGGGGIEG